MTKTKRGNKGKKGTLNKRKKMNKSTRKQFGGYWFYPSREDIRREEQIQQMSTALNELIAENSEIKRQRKNLIHSLLQTKRLPFYLSNNLLGILARYERAFKSQQKGSQDKNYIEEKRREASYNFNRDFSILMKKINDYLNENYHKFEDFETKNLSKSGGGGGPVQQMLPIIPSRENYSEGRNSDITPSCFGGFCNNPLREPLIAK